MCRPIRSEFHHNTGFRGCVCSLGGVSHSVAKTPKSTVEVYKHIDNPYQIEESRILATLFSCFLWGCHICPMIKIVLKLFQEAKPLPGYSVFPKTNPLMLLCIIESLHLVLRFILQLWNTWTSCSHFKEVSLSTGHLLLSHSKQALYCLPGSFVVFLEQLLFSCSDAMMTYPEQLMLSECCCFPFPKGSCCL